MAQAPFFVRSAGACPPRCPASRYVFRSFRSLMSIAARVVPFSRSFRSLIKRQRGEPLHIKVLQTLGCSVMQAAIDIKVLQTLGMARDRPSPCVLLSNCIPPVVQERLILIRSGSGNPELQRREGSPTGRFHRYTKHPQLNLARRGLLCGARAPTPSHSLKFISSCTSSRERDAITSHEVTRLLKSTAFAESPRLS